MSSLFRQDQAPATLTEPVTLAEAKAQCRIIANDEDPLIAELITAAREKVEWATGHLLVRRARIATADTWDELLLMDAPVASISSVAYLNSAGVSTAWIGFYANVSSRPVRIVAALNGIVPVVADLPGAVSVTYLAGYASAAQVPTGAKNAMRMLISHWFHNRETVLVGSISKEMEFGFTDAIKPMLGPGYA